MNRAGLVFMLLLLAGFIALCIYKRVYNSRSHTKYDKQYLKADAKIVDIQTKTVGLKGERVYRTTVTFSDGFEYISHKTNVTNHFMSYTISITPAMKIDIINEATYAHSEALGIAPVSNRNTAPVQTRVKTTIPASNTNTDTSDKPKSVKMGKLPVDKSEVLTCPICNRKQIPTRRSCYHCGVNFEFDNDTELTGEIKPAEYVHDDLTKNQ